jgi:hypothetical protein
VPKYQHGQYGLFCLRLLQSLSQFKGANPPLILLSTRQQRSCPACFFSRSRVRGLIFSRRRILIKWLLRRRIAASEREFGYDASYARDILAASAKAFFAFKQISS